MYFEAVTNGKGNLEVHFLFFRHGFEDIYGPFAANFAVRRGLSEAYFSVFTEFTKFLRVDCNETGF